MEWVNEISLAPECHEVFITQDACPELSAADIVLAGVAQMRKRYIVARRDPEQHTLLFTTAGQGRLYTPHGEAVIAPNSMTLLPAHQSFRFELDLLPEQESSAEQAHWHLGWLLLENSRYWQRLTRQLPVTRYCRQAVPVYHLLILLHYELAGEAEERGERLAQIRKQLSKALIDVTPERSQLSRLQRLFSGLEEQLHRPWSVEELASRYPCSAPHLHRLCQRYLGVSPKQYLLQMRVARAQHLLRYTDWQISEIASRVGYQDLFTFSKLFRKQTNCSPSLYRQSAG